MASAASSSGGSATTIDFVQGIQHGLNAADLDASFHRHSQSLSRLARRGGDSQHDPDDAGGTARDHRRSRQRRPPLPAAVARGSPRAAVHPRLSRPRLSPDLGRPGDRHGGAGAAPERSRRGDRIGRLQRPLLSRRRSGEDLGGRPQRRPRGARPPQAVRGEDAARPCELPALLRRREHGGERRRLRSPHPSGPRRRQRGLLERAPCLGPPPHQRLRPRLLPPRDVGQVHRRWPPPRQALRLRAGGRAARDDARRAARGVRALRRADLRQALRPMALAPAGLPVRPRHPAGAVPQARRRPSRRHRRRAAPPAGAPGLRLPRGRELLRLAGPRPPLRQPAGRRRCRPTSSADISMRYGRAPIASPITSSR